MAQLQGRVGICMLGCEAQSALDKHDAPSDHLCFGHLPVSVKFYLFFKCPHRQKEPSLQG